MMMIFVVAILFTHFTTYLWIFIRTLSVVYGYALFTSFLVDDYTTTTITYHINISEKENESITSKEK